MKCVYLSSIFIPAIYGQASAQDLKADYEKIVPDSIRWGSNTWRRISQYEFYQLKGQTEKLSEIENYFRDNHCKDDSFENFSCTCDAGNRVLKKLNQELVIVLNEKNPNFQFECHDITKEYPLDWQMNYDHGVAAVVTNQGISQYYSGCASLTFGGTVKYDEAKKYCEDRGMTLPKFGSQKQHDDATAEITLRGGSYWLQSNWLKDNEFTHDDGTIVEIFGNDLITRTKNLNENYHLYWYRGNYKTPTNPRSSLFDIVCQKDISNDEEDF